MKTSVFPLVLSLLTSFCVAAQKFEIVAVQGNGSGCPPGSIETTLSDDKKSVAFIYHNFTAHGETTFFPDESRKNCQLSLTVKVPESQSFAFDKISYNGEIHLDDAIQGIHQSLYYFQGQTAQGQGSTTIVGPTDETCTFTDVFQPTVWSPCGKTTVVVNVNTVLRVDISGHPDAHGSMVARTGMTPSFKWKSC